MGFSDKKLEISIVALMAVMVMGMGYLFRSPVQKVLSGDFTFEMPRPKAFFASLFDLGDREVDRKYINPFEKKKKDDKVAAADKAKPLPAPTASPTVQAKKADDKKKDADKKPTVDVNVVQAAPKDGLGEGSGAGEKIADAGRDNGNGNTAAAADETKEKDKMAAAQWRALLSAQPTKENVQKLAAALNAGEIDQASYLSIATDLLRSNKAETQKLGVYALTFNYSAQAFSLGAQYYDQLDASAQTDAHAYMVSYATSGRLAILKSVLQSSNTATVELATEVVIAGYNKVKNGGGSTDPRDSRGNGQTNSGSSVANYSQFVPVFQSLAQSNDPTIAQLASSALSQIQVSVAAL